MAKAIYICYKENKVQLYENQVIKRITDICKEITPVNLTECNPEISSFSHIFYGLSHPAATIIRKGANLMLGFLNDNDKNWYKVKTKKPDGTFVIIRSDDDCIELLTDTTGSRSVWYYLDHEKFIAATSQIAITRYLGNFSLNRKILPWILSTGTLGPGNSWDDRVKKVKPNTSVLLDRKNWTLTESTESVKFSKNITDYDEGKRLLKNCIKKLIEEAVYDPAKWFIPLSGGYDSRALLLFLRDLYPQNRYRTVTWGTKEARNRAGSDAFIAGELSNEIDITNHFYESNRNHIDYAERLDRFIFNSEGTIDHISAYIDGFVLWNDLVINQGCEGIIRGEIPFGPCAVNNEFEVRKIAGLHICRDYDNLKEVDEWVDEQQTIPSELMKVEDESFQDYLDRLYLEYRVPVVVSPLADVKYSYVEQSMPFFSNKMIQLFCSFSDELRRDKKIFRDIVDELGVNTPIATKSANEAVELILRNPDIVNLFRKVLSGRKASEIFPERFIQNVINNLKSYNKPFYKVYKLSFHAKNRLKQEVQVSVLKNAFTQQKVSYNLIAFRMVIFIKMHSLLNDQ